MGSAALSNNSFDTFMPYKKYPYTAFNSYNTDRIVETTSMCVMALLDARVFVAKGTANDLIINNAVSFLKDNFKQDLGFGFVPATYAGLLAITAYELSALYPYTPLTHIPHTTA